jgi:outer membrane immunogenic protein
MKKLLLGSSALVAAMLAGSAIAADIPRAPIYKAAPTAAATVASAWTGVYVGGHCGGAWSRTRTIDNDGLFEWHTNGSGGFCGGQLGYNFQQDKLVFGLEGDLSFPWFKASNGALDESDLKSSEVKYGWFGTLTARLGLTFDRSLFYVKGGAAIARIKNSEFENAGDPVDSSATTNTKVGWALGGGAEYAWTPNWSWKLEYVYMDFGGATSFRPDGNAFDYRNRLHTVKLGINYRWGAGPLR